MNTSSIVVPHLSSANIHRDVSHQTHGFLLEKSTFTPIDPPGGPVFTVTGMNLRRQIVGYYRNISVGNKILGFLFDAGHFPVIDVPEAGFFEPQAINIWGQIVGVTGMTQLVGFLATPKKP